MPLAKAQALNTLLDSQDAAGGQCCLPLSDGANSYLNNGHTICATVTDTINRDVWINAAAPGLEGKCIDDARLANYVAGLIGACTTPNGQSVGGWQAVAEVTGMNVLI